jgi:hypothetical protein
VQPDFINEAGKIDPAAHGFARAARVNDLFHALIFPQSGPRVNEGRISFGGCPQQCCLETFCFLAKNLAANPTLHSLWNALKLTI